LTSNRQGAIVGFESCVCQLCDILIVFYLHIYCECKSIV